MFQWLKPVVECNSFARSVSQTPAPVIDYFSSSPAGLQATAPVVEYPAPVVQSPKPVVEYISLLTAVEGHQGFLPSDTLQGLLPRQGSQRNVEQLGKEGRKERRKEGRKKEKKKKKERKKERKHSLNKRNIQHKRPPTDNRNKDKNKTITTTTHTPHTPHTPHRSAPHNTTHNTIHNTQGELRQHWSEVASGCWGRHFEQSHELQSCSWFLLG